VSLGGGKYLEIIAPQEGAQLSAVDDAMRGLNRLRIIGWAVSVSDVDAAVASLKGAGFTVTPPQPGARVTPSGERLEWTTFELAETIATAPFFIHWSAATSHPSTTAPGGCELASFTVIDPQSDRLAAALGALEVSEIGVANPSALIANPESPRPSIVLAGSPWRGRSRNCRYIARLWSSGAQ
jgi:hypothetical protein